MRKITLGVMGLLMTAGSALAAGNDLFELSLGGRFMLDQDYLGDEEFFDPSTATFPTVGAYNVGFGVGTAIGHRFTTRKGTYDVLLRYNFSLSPETSEPFYTDATGLALDVDTPVAGMTINEVTGTLYQHDVLMVFRLSSDIFPYDWLRMPGLYADLFAGVSTMTFDYEVSSVEAFNPASPEVVTSNDRTRSGGIFGLGLGYNLELQETVSLQFRGDLTFGRIQDMEDLNGNLKRTSPSSSNIGLNVVLSKQFESLF